MPRLNDSELLAFDADATLDRVLETVDNPLFSFVEFTSETFVPLYVAEETIEYYEGREPMLDHFEEIHGYITLDFTEQELFTTSLFPDAERVEYLVTAMDFVTLVRVYAGQSGVYIGLHPDEAIGPVVDTVSTDLQMPEP